MNFVKHSEAHIETCQYHVGNIEFYPFEIYIFLLSEYNHAKSCRKDLITINTIV